MRPSRVCDEGLHERRGDFDATTDRQNRQTAQHGVVVATSSANVPTRLAAEHEAHTHAPETYMLARRITTNAHGQHCQLSENSIVHS
mmetsp:Transcript_18345/g.42296  ORF Transcript_18345/g.42296 Transcript_18345/m.42296 type:complete len:87 (-) Transcript_18345:80-340(-)